MLRQLRQKKVMKRILWVLAIIIIPAFVLWGAGSMGEGRSYAGIAFGKKISLKEYGNAWEEVKNEALMSYGERFHEVIEYLDLDNQAWERLIMLKEAKTKKIKASDNEVRAFIASIPVFLDNDGSFNQQKYNIILSSTFRITARKFEENIRDRLKVMKLLQGVVPNIEVTDAEIEEALAKEEELKKELEGKDEEAKKPEKKKEKEEKKEEKKETPEQKRERIKQGLTFQKRIQALQNWRNELFERAALIDNIKIMKEAQLPPEEEPIQEE